MSTSRVQPALPIAQTDKPSVHATPAVGAPLIGPRVHKQWNLQHEVHKRVIGGLYSPRDPIEAALMPKENHIPRILDVGTGSGIWAVEMANKFPQCEVIGIDIVLPASISSQPANLRFEVADVNQTLPLEDASVDFVFARGMNHAILDHPKWLSEASRIMRPGGVCLFFATTKRLLREDGTELPAVPIGEQGYTGFQSIMSAIFNLPIPRWGSGLPHDHWTTWMRENGNFEKAEMNENTLEPVGPWQAGVDENGQIASEKLREALLMFIVEYRPILLSEGHDEAIVNRWIEDATSELEELRVQVSLEWVSAWCVRSGNEWKPSEAKIAA